MKSTTADLAAPWGQRASRSPTGTHHIEGGIVTIGGPPNMEPAIAYRPTYSFTISGAERKVTEVCAAYLSLLLRMVEQCEADCP